MYACAIVCRNNSVHVARDPKEGHAQEIMLQFIEGSAQQRGVGNTKMITNLLVDNTSCALDLSLRSNHVLCR